MHRSSKSEMRKSYFPKSDMRFLKRWTEKKGWFINNPDIGDSLLNIFRLLTEAESVVSFNFTFQPSISSGIDAYTMLINFDFRKEGVLYPLLTLRFKTVRVVHRWDKKTLLDCFRLLDKFIKEEKVSNEGNALGIDELVGDRILGNRPNHKSVNQLKQLYPNDYLFDESYADNPLSFDYNSLLNKEFNREVTNPNNYNKHVVNPGKLTT